MWSRLRIKIPIESLIATGTVPLTLSIGLISLLLRCVLFLVDFLL